MPAVRCLRLCCLRGERGDDAEEEPQDHAQLGAQQEGVGDAEDLMREQPACQRHQQGAGEGRRSPKRFERQGCRGGLEGCEEDQPGDAQVDGHRQQQVVRVVRARPLQGKGDEGVHLGEQLAVGANARAGEREILDQVHRVAPGFQAPGKGVVFVGVQHRKELAGRCRWRQPGKRRRE